MFLRALTRVVICTLTSASVGGFIAGFIHCSDCQSVFSRIALGLIWSILSPFAGGRIPEDGSSSTQTYNTWEYGIPGAILIFILWTSIAEGLRYRASKNVEKPNNQG